MYRLRRSIFGYVYRQIGVSGVKHEDFLIGGGKLPGFGYLKRERERFKGRVHQSLQWQRAVSLGLSTR